MKLTEMALSRRARTSTRLDKTTQWVVYSPSSKLFWHTMYAVPPKDAWDYKTEEAALYEVNVLNNHYSGQPRQAAQHAPWEARELTISYTVK